MGEVCVNCAAGLRCADDPCPDPFFRFAGYRGAAFAVGDWLLAADQRRGRFGAGCGGYGRSGKDARRGALRDGGGGAFVCHYMPVVAPESVADFGGWHNWRGISGAGCGGLYRLLAQANPDPAVRHIGPALLRAAVSGDRCGIYVVCLKGRNPWAGNMSGL